jgi:hypothetical protein
MDKPKKKELNSKYKFDFKQLQELVNSFDPISLIEGGAPDDEYDCLTEHILSYVYKKKTKTEMEDLVRHEIEHHFGLVVEEKYKEKFRTDIEEFIETVYDKFELNEKQNT